MLLAEQVLLLARDMHGQLLNSMLSKKDIERWLAVALLVELAAMGRLRFSEARISATDHMPTQYSLLTDALAIVYRKQPLSVTDAISSVLAESGRMQQEILESMVRRGILMKQKQLRFGFFPVSQYPVQSTRSHGEAVDQLRAAVAQADHNDLRALGLYLICDGMGLIQALLGADSASDGAQLVVQLESQLAGNRAATDPTLSRARLIMMLTNPFADMVP